MNKKVIKGYPQLLSGGGIALFDNPPEERDSGNNMFRWKGLNEVMGTFNGKKVRITIKEVE